MIKLTLQDSEVQRLKRLLGTNRYDFLGCTLDLEQITLTDNLLDASEDSAPTELQVMVFSTLLAHYASAKPIPLTGNLVKYRDVPGGYAYEGAFIKRAVQPIAKAFGDNPEDLPRAAELLGGARCKLGDASAQVIALAGIPLTYILWVAEDLPASANVLYDSSASNYLPTEDLAVLGELTTLRLIDAKRIIV